MIFVWHTVWLFARLLAKGGNMKKFKKIIISLTVICTIIFAGVSLTGCKSNSKIYLNDVYAMGMMSAVNFFEANSTSSLKLGGLNSASASIPDANTKDTLSNYIQMFEGFLNYGVNPIESVLTAEDEKYSDYAKKISLTIGNECYIINYKNNTIYNLISNYIRGKQWIA